MDDYPPLLSIVIPTVNANERVLDILTELLSNDARNFEVVLSLNSPARKLELSSSLTLDPRLLVSSELIRLNVAESWTRAVEKSSGKYLWLIGDDDFILSKQLTKVLEILESQTEDCLTFNGLSYIFPSVFTQSKALSRNRHFRFRRSVLGILLEKQRHKVIANMFRFSPMIPLNMQLTIFSRASFQNIGNKFKMPFPDHIALMELLATVQNWKILDLQLCIVGMAPSSFGNSAYTNYSELGESYLGMEVEIKDYSTGSILNSIMYSWLQTLSENDERFTGLKPSIGNYILRQVGVSIRRYLSRQITFKTLVQGIAGERIRNLVFGVFAIFSFNNISSIFKLAGKKSGPELIIGAKFGVTRHSNIKSFAKASADSLRL
jgi:glycosyltransferase involved in cell wall biosynthesis